jgi:phosphate-selective porin
MKMTLKALLSSVALMALATSAQALGAAVAASPVPQTMARRQRCPNRQAREAAPSRAPLPMAR